MKTALVGTSSALRNSLKWLLVEVYNLILGTGGADFLMNSLHEVRGRLDVRF